MLRGNNVKGVMVTLEELENYLKDIIINKKINDDFDQKIYNNFLNELFYVLQLKNKKEIEKRLNSIVSMNLFVEENTIWLNIEYNSFDDIEGIIDEEEVSVEYFDTITEEEAIPIEYLLGEIIPYQKGYRIEKIIILENNK